MKTANHLTDPIASERPFLTRLGLRLVAIIAGCAAAFLLAYLIMLPVMILGQKLGPGLGSTAWGLGICAGYLVYRRLCKRFKLILRSKSGLDELFEKEENEVEDSASTLYEGGSEQIIDDAALTENEALSENENATEPALERVEEVKLNENEIKPTVEPIIEEEKAPQSEEQFQRDEEDSIVSIAPDDTEKGETGDITESDETKPEKAPKRRNTKRTKKICLIFSAIILAVGLFFAGRAIYLPIHTKAEHEQLVQNIKNRISDGTIKQQEIEEAISGLERCDWKHSYCNYDHLKAIEELLNLYMQQLTDYCKTDVTQSVNIAMDIMYRWDNTKLGDSYEKYQKINLIEKGLEILRYAAEKGDAESQFALGYYYMHYGGNGPFIKYDANYYSEEYKKAVYWFLQAAEQGHISAMGSLGEAYIEGKGVSRNEKKGVYWINRAANLGDVNSQCLLGDFYRDGVYVKTGSHKEQIVDALESALRGQTQYTTVSVDDFDYNKVILPKDIEQAKYWWRLAAESGNETAKERLQRIYE